MPPPADFDWKRPDYVTVFRQRVERLGRIRADPSCLPALRTYYRDHPADFIRDFGCLTEPRNAGTGRPTVIPFILFPRQIECIEWILESWRNQRPGVCPKSRESGISWLAVALSCTLCLFYDGVTIGFGSRLAEYVDNLGDPKSLFWKARRFIELLPVEFRNGFNPKTDAPHMRLQFRATGSVITGEGGDNLGRGNRSSLYFVDEAAHLQHPEMVDAALSQTTNCRIDVSTARGLGNPFHRKVTEWPADRVFRFHWRDDPRKDDDWYRKQCEELSPVVVAQEIDINFAASVEGVLIPSAWVQSAMDAHAKLGIAPTGARAGGLDVADEGSDLNAFCGAHGVVIEALEEWSGKGDDIFGTVQRAFGLCDANNYHSLKYDADGLGAGVRGDARVLNDGRPVKLDVQPFRGSGPVFEPEKQDVKGRLNKDYFTNAKAQAWWSLRTRFQMTHRWIVEGVPCGRDEIISIPSYLPLARKLASELSQPTYSVGAVGKIIVDKAPEGTRSPNLADAVMIRFGRAHKPMTISAQALQRAMV